MILVAHSFYLQRDPKQFERLKPYPPLTTLLAVAILRDAGHPVSLFDATFEASPQAFADRLDAERPEIVLLIEDNFNFLTKMCTEARRQDALDMIAVAARRRCRVAVNGPDASDHPGLYLAAGADAVIDGEGEFGVAELVAALRDRMRLDQVPGLLLAASHGHRRTLPRRQQQDLDAVPLPAWDLADIAAYRRVWLGAHGYFSWNMATSRGCPYSCNWCAKPTFGRRYSQRSPASVADEMQRLRRAVAPDHIWFADDIFGMTEQWIVDFAHELAMRGTRIPFMIQTRTNLIDPRTAAALGAAGATEVWLGVESGSQRILDAMDKGTRVDAARLATRTLKAEGIRVGWFLQLGYPSEQWEDIVLTRDLVHQEWPDDIGVSVSYPLPGTVFHERVVAELGERRNWRHTDDLAMLFQGTFATPFYRMVRDALHADVSRGAIDPAAWQRLARGTAAYRSAAPVGVSLHVA